MLWWQRSSNGMSWLVPAVGVTCRLVTHSGVKWVSKLPAAWWDDLRLV